MLGKEKTPRKDELAKIPALTLSGGKLLQTEFALEFRIWICTGEGDDFYYRYDTLKEAKKDRKKLLGRYGADEIIAVVWDNINQRYREVVI